MKITRKKTVIYRSGTVIAIATNVQDAKVMAASFRMLEVLQELEESAGYWSEYDVPIGIVSRINKTIKKATK
jgi:hypothetical protein